MFRKSVLNENLLVFARAFSLISLIAVTVSLSACATGVDRVKLHNPLTYQPKQTSSGSIAHAAPSPAQPELQERKALIKLRKVKDTRPDITCIGVKKNTYGTPLGKVDVEESVVFMDLFEKNLTSCFESAGYEVISSKHSTPPSSAGTKNDSGALMDANVRAFWVEFMPGFFIVDAASDVVFEISLVDPKSNQEIWSDTFRGKGKVSSGVAVTRDMFEESINVAYAEAMKKLYEAITGPRFQDTVLKCHY